MEMKKYPWEMQEKYKKEKIIKKKMKKAEMKMMTKEELHGEMLKQEIQEDN